MQPESESLSLPEARAAIAAAMRTAQRGQVREEASNQVARGQPTPQTLRLLTDAAAIKATDCTIEETAKILGVNQSTLGSHIVNHRTIWDELLAEARLHTAQQRRPRGVTWQQIRKACPMVAGGARRNEAAEAIGLAVGTVKKYRRVYREPWEFEWDQAMETSLQIIRRQAGTDAVLKDVKGYLRRGLNCERWARANNRPLFEDTGEVTLWSFYETYYRPLRGGSPRGIAAFRSTLRYWALLTGDPPLKQITVELFIRFRDCLREAGGRGGRGSMANNTIRKHIRTVQTLLDKCGPPGRGNRDGADLLERPPWVKPPRKEYAVVRSISIEVIGRVYEAADVMQVPQLEDVSPAAWWRALLAVAWNTGLRKRNLLDMQFDWIDWSQCRVEIPAKKHKTGRGQSLHLNRTALEHLHGIRTDRELVFPWTGNRLLTEGTCSSFHRAFRRLQLAAGLEGKDRIGLQRLRQTVGTTLWEHSPQAAALQLGHTNLETTRRHYVQTQPIIIRALDGFPQPEAFDSGGQSA